MPKPLRVGIMGTTYPSLRHTEAFAAIPGVTIAAVADPNDKLRAAFVKQFGAMQQFKDYPAMLRWGGLDAVVIGLPTGMHTRACMDSFDAGMHVLCEKPPTTNAAEMIRVAKKSERTGLTYMFSRQFRFSDGSLQSRKLVEAGRLGDLYHAEAKWLRARFLPPGIGLWRLDKNKGGGVLLDLGIHAIDEAWFVMGCPRPVEVSAGLHCAFAHMAYPGQTYTADDLASGLIRFENGATLFFTASSSLNWPGSSPAKIGESSNPELRETSIFGSHGGVQIVNSQHGNRITGNRNRIRVQPLSPMRQAIPAGAAPTFYRQAQDFVRAVRQRATPVNSASQAVMLMQMLDALRKSGDTGRAVTIRKVA